MRPALTSKELQGLGLSRAAARTLAKRLQRTLAGNASLAEPGEQARLWADLQDLLARNPAWGVNFALHRRFFTLAFEGRRADQGPAPAWTPSPEGVRESNLGKLMAERGVSTYSELQRWSAEHREDFWRTMIGRLGIVFRRPPERILGLGSDPTRPKWLPGAELNIAESCFHADDDRVAILHGTEAAAEPRRMTYGELHALANRVANGLEALGVAPGGRVAVYLPMVPESVAIYLGVVLAGRCVVGIADTSAPEEFAKRARIAAAQSVFTIESYLRGGKEHRIYDKVVAAHGPRAVVLPAADGPPKTARQEDRAWDDFLSDRTEFEPARCRPDDYTNILFSSGTTKDPKAIPWTHVTPIKCAADAYLHHDVRPSDVLAWPTSFGWMMGPWLTYASLANGAAMGLFLGDPQRREFGEFVARAGVTILGVVPKLVRAWRASRTMEGLDWSRVRLFSSTAEPSTPEDMLYLMFLAGYKPIIEYCGGTEIGGGYLTGTVVQPCAPATFTTPALGLDLVILDEGRPADRGEVFLVPPSIGLSNELLNYDHDREYYAGVPRGPHGEVLRRHGDRIERLPGGFYRHLGRVDDMINIGGVKTSAEEVRSVIANPAVYDAKPVAVDVDGSGQHALVVYAVPRDAGDVGSQELRDRLRQEFQRAIKERLNPLLAHVHDVVLVPELPQAGPGKTRTMKELSTEYEARIRHA